MYWSVSSVIKVFSYNRAVVLYNSLTTTREQVVSLHISDPAVMVWMIELSRSKYRRVLIKGAEHLINHVLWEWVF